MALASGEIRKSVRISYTTGSGNNVTEAMVASAWYSNTGINVNFEFPNSTTYPPTTNKAELQASMTAFLQSLNATLNGDSFPKVLASS